MEPIKELKTAVRAVEGFEGNPAEFILLLADDLHDDLGLNLAIINDSAIARGWQPDGSDQHEGYTEYRYA
ncbi:MAG: hypothetical protein AAF633_20745 [Chloroflexota bacterium]